VATIKELDKEQEEDLQRLLQTLNFCIAAVYAPK
jgi:hypothetical protein